MLRTFFLKIMNWLYFFQLFSYIFFNTGETGGKKDNASFKPLSASFWSGGGQGDDGDHDYDNKYENNCYDNMLTVIMMITMTMIMLIMTVMIKKNTIIDGGSTASIKGFLNSQLL